MKEIIQCCRDDAPLLIVVQLRIEKAVRHQVRELAMCCVLDVLRKALLNDANSAVVDVMNLGIQLITEFFTDV